MPKTKPDYQVGYIDLSEITIGERVREDFNPAKMEVLKNSIKEKGLINPLTINLVKDKKILMAGERRYRACKELKITTVPVRIYDNATDLDVKEVELYENLHRDDLTPDEETSAKLAIHEIQVAKHGKKSSPSDEEGASMRTTAALIGDSPTNFMRDIDLAKAMKAFPGLKKAKTKSEAHSMLNKLERKYKEHKAVKEMEAAEDRESPGYDEMVAMTNSYILGDFFEEVKEIADNTVKLVELDWPYGVDLKDMKKHGNKSSEVSDEYNEIPATDYPDFIKRTFAECYRTMAKDSWLICWFGSEPWFETVYSLALDAGFTGRRLCGEWIKPGTGQSMRPLKYMSNQSEWFFYFAKGAPELHIPGRSNIFTYNTVSAQTKSHPTERPIEMIQDVLDTFAYPGAIVMVPFLGSGNTLLAAKNLQMTSWGYDLSEEYRNSYLVKLQEQEMGKFRSYR